MEDIVSQVKRVTDLIGEITAASMEQTSGISQVGDAVNQLDQVTQQNAALVEESAAAAESLKHQAMRLAQTVAAFRIDKVDGQATARDPGRAVGAPPATAPRKADAKPRAAASKESVAVAKGSAPAGDDWAEF